MAVWQKLAVLKKPNYAAYVGRYHDAWLGDVNVIAQGNQLWLKASRSPRLTGQLLSYQGNTYVVRWRNRSINADAFVAFTRRAGPSQQHQNEARFGRDRL